MTQGGDREVHDSYSAYRSALIGRFWDYVHKTRIPSEMLELRQADNPNRPPVFVPSKSGLNLVLPQGAAKDRVLAKLAGKPRHRWFRSMSSSQALTWSVFGALSAYDKLDLLSGIVLPADDGNVRPRFVCELEYDVNYLGEPRHTSIDVMLSAESGVRMAVECKLSESDVGTCSRPRLPTSRSEYCDGKYCRQHGRQASCSLEELGAAYWRYLAKLTTWRTKSDIIDPCPLRSTYQIARNIIAASASANTVQGVAGACTLLVDSRNPAFMVGGKGFQAFDSIRSSLREPSLLRMVTWQDLMGRMQADGTLNWLVDGLRFRYGL